MLQGHYHIWAIFDAWFGRDKFVRASDWDRSAPLQQHKAAIDGDTAKALQVPDFIETMHTMFGGDREPVRPEEAIRQLLLHPVHSVNFSEILKAR